MRYMLLIVGDESRYADMPEDERAASSARWADYTNELVQSGSFVAGDGLQTTATATTIQVKDGERVLTDGPFADTKEQLGGYYVIDVADLDAAVDWAARLPSVEAGGIAEIRPVMEYTDQRLAQLHEEAAS